MPSSSPKVSGLCPFVLSTWQPCPHSNLLCLSALRVPASLPVPCGTAPPRGRPGQGLGLPCLDTSRNSATVAALKGPAWLGPATMGPLCPARGLLQQATHRFPAQPQPAPHTSAIRPQAPVPTLGAGILPPKGRAWESHAARPGNWFCRIPWAVLPGWEPGGLQGQEPGRTPRTGCDISVPATTSSEEAPGPILQ